MSIWTRIADTLSSIGGSVAQFLQRMASATSTPPEKSIAFTIGMIALGAKMAKADGVVDAVEIAAFKQVFHVPDGELAGVARVFNLAKQDTAGFESYAAQIARLFEPRSPLLEDVLDGLFHIAKADDALHPDERAFLREVAVIFGFGAGDYARIEARHAVVLDDPYLVLGVARGSHVDEIKRRYRELVREYHPDRHIAAGVPAEMIDIVTGHLQKVNEAYERILKEHAL